MLLLEREPVRLARLLAVDERGVRDRAVDLGRLTGREDSGKRGNRIGPPRLPRRSVCVRGPIRVVELLVGKAGSKQEEGVSGRSLCTPRGHPTRSDLGQKMLSGLASQRDERAPFSSGLAPW